MKHIKKFNEGIELFKQLGYNDLVELDINSKQKENFTSKEIKTLKDNFKSKKILWMRSYEVEIHSVISNIEITKLEDEWFYIRLYRGNKHFKCDGFEGLITFLKKYLH